MFGAGHAATGEHDKRLINVHLKEKSLIEA